MILDVLQFHHSRGMLLTMNNISSSCLARRNAMLQGCLENFGGKLKPKLLLEIQEEDVEGLMENGLAFDRAYPLPVYERLGNITLKISGIAAVGLHLSEMVHW